MGRRVKRTAVLAAIVILAGVLVGGQAAYASGPRNGGDRDGKWRDGKWKERARMMKKEFYERLPDLKVAAETQKAKYEAFMRERGFEP